MSQSARKSIRHVLFCQESYRQSPLFGDALSCPETAFKQGAKGHQQKLILKVFSGKIVRQKYPFCSDTEPWCALFVPKRPSNTTQQGTTRGVATARGRSSAGAFFGSKAQAGSRNISWSRAEEESGNSDPPIQPQHRQHTTTLATAAAGSRKQQQQNSTNLQQQAAPTGITNSEQSQLGCQKMLSVGVNHCLV